jgi:hypothetical protein
MYPPNPFYAFESVSAVIIVNESSFHGDKCLKYEVTHSFQSSAEIKILWGFAFTSPYIFIAFCLSLGMTLPFIIKPTVVSRRIMMGFGIVGALKN